MPNQTKQDFCCLIISGFGAGSQAGVILRDHLRDSGIDAFLTTPSGKEEPRLDHEHWIHGVRMEYLALRKQYQRVALIGLSLGGLLLIHLLDLHPAAIMFVNAPCVRMHGRGWNRIFQADLQARFHGALRAPLAKRQLNQLIEQTRARGVLDAKCPALILQTMDDRVCSPSNADDLFDQLHMPDKTLRLYQEGGHDVLTSRTVLAACSDIFQFSSRVRGNRPDEAE